MITIIVMLILAGVAINLALNSNGLFTKAGEATAKYNEAVRNEQSLLDAITEYESYTSFNGVNNPKLTEGMIPVYYDGGWKKADSTNANNTWYKYDTNTKQWANVVTVKETGGTKTRAQYVALPVGEPIAESD